MPGAATQLHPIIEDKREDIRRLCERYKVKRLEVFGSAVKCHFDPETSDLDFLVEYLELEPEEHAKAYFGLVEELEALMGRPIDLVMTRAIRNPYFLRSINKNRTTIYER